MNVFQSIEISVRVFLQDVQFESGLNSNVQWSINQQNKNSKSTICNRLFNAFIFLNSSYKKVQEVYLESQFWEEPSVFAFLVSFFKNGTDLIAGLLLLHGIFQHLLVNVVLVEADVNTVASGHQVVVVDDLENRQIEMETKDVFVHKVNSSKKCMQSSTF